MRRLALWLAVASVVIPAASAQAAGGTYDVVFCSSLNRDLGGTVEKANVYSARDYCAEPTEDFAFKINNVERALEGRSAEVFWEAEPPLAIVAAQAEAKLRRAAGYHARLYTADERGRLTHLVATGSTDGGDYTPYSWTGTPQPAFYADLVCVRSPSCAPSDQAKTLVRDLRFTVADYADPEVEVDGSLYGGGWLRGEARSTLRTSDLGSGIARLQLLVDGEDVRSEEGVCPGVTPASSVARSMTPCVENRSMEVLIDTTADPFEDGVNFVSGCAMDFASNEVCRESVVRIDNHPPSLTFPVSQDPEDPELITVPALDEHSGVASGQILFRAVGATDWRPLLTQRLPGRLTARVDSAAEPPGTYEFIARAGDVAGNSAETTLREDGTPMRLEFPLRSGVELSAHLEPGGSRRTAVAYGRNARVEGRLTDAAGTPMPGQEIVVDEDFGEGALIDHRVRTVVTDEAGRWSSRAPAGPSRTVTAAYAGDQRYLADEAAAGRLVVRSRASLRLTRNRVPEGRATAFVGRIGRLGARVPPRGKLIQLQYQEPGSGRWFTVRNPFHTRSNGRYRFRYEFGTHYVTNVAIRFRLRVPPEYDWPYRPSRSRARRVIVKAR